MPDVPWTNSEATGILTVPSDELIAASIAGLRGAETLLAATHMTVLIDFAERHNLLLDRGYAGEGKEGWTVAVYEGRLERWIQLLVTPATWIEGNDVAIRTLGMWVENFGDGSARCWETRAVPRWYGFWDGARREASNALLELAFEDASGYRIADLDPTPMGEGRRPGRGWT